MKTYVCGVCFKSIKPFREHYCDRYSWFDGKSLARVLNDLHWEKQDKASINTLCEEEEKYAKLLQRVANLEKLLEKKCEACGHIHSTKEQVEEINSCEKKL